MSQKQKTAIYNRTSIIILIILIINFVIILPNWKFSALYGMEKQAKFQLYSNWLRDCDIFHISIKFS